MPDIICVDMPADSAAHHRTTVIIVNYCTSKATLECLSSLAAERESDTTFDVILVDNASLDNSSQVLIQAIHERGWDGWVTFLQAPRNGGFAYGNNFGIAYTASRPIRPDYFLLLNPDTIVSRQAIRHLVACMRDRPSIGVIGGQLLDNDGAPQCSGFRFPNLLGELESGAKLGLLTRHLRNSKVALPINHTPAPVDWVSGACCLIRRSVFEQIGGLDERYFMYYEEVDYCLRAKRHGWEVWHVPHAEITHSEGTASGIKDTHKPKPGYWYESRRRFFVKNHSRAYAFLAEVAFLIGHMSWRLRRKWQGKPDSGPKRRIRDGWRHVALAALREK